MKPEFHPKKNWGEGGGELWIENCPDYCGKLLVFRAGGKTSMHHHVKKLETMYLHSGKMLIRFEDRTLGLEPGDKVQIQRGEKHQLIAIEDSELFEVSTQHFESDSIKTMVE